MLWKNESGFCGHDFLLAEKGCLTTQELNAFEKVKAIFFCGGVILAVGRVSKYSWGADW